MIIEQLEILSTRQQRKKTLLGALVPLLKDRNVVVADERILKESRIKLGSYLVANYPGIVSGL